MDTFFDERSVPTLEVEHLNYLPAFLWWPQVVQGDVVAELLRPEQMHLVHHRCQMIVTP